MQSLTPDTVAFQDVILAASFVLKPSRTIFSAAVVEEPWETI